ncbi:MAG: TRAP transporter large permease subunit [Deltaproteobacteria bacterium]|nr:TRAP transporter large permease subunit [Deltaproteobacteria bacterium]
MPPNAFAIIGTILVLVLLSAPLFLIIGSLSCVSFYFLATEYQDFDSYQLIIEKIFSLSDKNVLLAVPFFVVAGSLMTAGGIARRIIEFADALVGWLPGGLAVAAVLSCMFFAAISGSSPVTVIAIGSIMFPALVRHGYDEKFSLGLVTSAGSLGILIPPSIPMIIYAISVGGVMTVNVADLFIAGVVPGLVVGGVLIAYSVFHGITPPGFSWSSVKAPSPRRVFEKLANGFWALLLPVLILGGIYPIFGDQGFFTPTEAAAVSVIYAFLVELFVHRELDLKRLPALLVDSTVMMGVLLIIMILSFALNHYLVDQEIADHAVAWMSGLDLSRFTFLLALNGFLLIVGCFMDIMSAILVIAPLVAPMAHSFGIGAIHLGIIFIVNLEIGYLTPPIGMNLFVSATLFKKRVGDVIRAVLVFVLLMTAGLMAITYVEPIAVGLVRVMNGQDFWSAPESAPEDPRAPKPDEPQLGTPSTTTSTGSKVKTLRELMEEAKTKREGAGSGASDGRVKTLQELMKEAKEKREDPAPATETP